MTSQTHLMVEADAIAPAGGRWDAPTFAAFGLALLVGLAAWVASTVGLDLRYRLWTAAAAVPGA